MQPLYNRKLRNSRRLVVLRKTITKDGYFSLTIGKGEEIKSEELDDVLGIFKSQKSAKDHLVHLTNEFGLCQKLLGLQKVAGPCFSYHLEKCKGACVGKENAMIFNARFIMAFSKTKMQSWPFNGPVVVKEKKEDFGEALVFDKWVYLGKYSEYAYEEKDGTTPLSDFDIYKILQSFLKDPKNLKKISTLNKIEEFSRMQNLI
jgi:DNA polymerase-3 subunit epsilon